MKPSVFSSLFFLVVVLHLLAISAGWVEVEMATKPLIVLTLLAYYLAKVKSRSAVFIAALLFCCVGDSVLLLQGKGELYFMLGLGAFLLGHVFYILSYRQHSDMAPGEKVGTQKIRLAFPVVLAGTGLVVVLLPSLGSLKVPVMIYALVITLMVVSAIFRLGRTSAPSFWLVLAGSLLFMVSDSLLAINKFMMSIPFASLWIMVTYCSAQFLIVEGMLRSDIGN